MLSLAYFFPFLSPSTWPTKAEGVAGPWLWASFQPGRGGGASPAYGTFTHLIPWQEEKLPARNLQALYTVLIQPIHPQRFLPHKGSGVGAARNSDICITHFFLSHPLSTHHHPLEFSRLRLAVKSHTFSQSICKPGRIDS